MIKRTRIKAIDRRKCGAAPSTRVDAQKGHRPDERQRTVDVSVPDGPPADEFVRVEGFQPALALAVANLLAPIALHRCSVMVPDERRWGEANLSFTRLQAPADVDIVTGPNEKRSKATDRQQRIASEGHIASRYVLGAAVIQQHTSRTAWRTRNALCHPRVVWRNDVGTARFNNIRRREQRLNEIREPIRIHAYVGVGVRNDFA